LVKAESNAETARLIALKESTILLPIGQHRAVLLVSGVVHGDYWLPAPNAEAEVIEQARAIPAGTPDNLRPALELVRAGMLLRQRLENEHGQAQWPRNRLPGAAQFAEAEPDDYPVEVRPSIAHFASGGGNWQRAKDSIAWAFVANSQGTFVKRQDVDGYNVRDVQSLYSLLGRMAAQAPHPTPSQ